MCADGSSLGIISRTHAAHKHYYSIWGKITQWRGREWRNKKKALQPIKQPTSVHSSKESFTRPIIRNSFLVYNSAQAEEEVWNRFSKCKKSSIILIISLSDVSELFFLCWSLFSGIFFLRYHSVEIRSEEELKMNFWLAKLLLLSGINFRCISSHTKNLPVPSSLLYGTGIPSLLFSLSLNFRT